MGYLQYDDARHRVRQLLTVADTLGFVVNTTGTNASNVELFRLRVPRKITVDEASVVIMTGGTVASATNCTLAIQKSVAGTGTASTIGSYNIAGTTADNTASAITVTSTDFAAGDHLLVVCLAGTVAKTGQKAQLLIGWKETFPATVDPGTSN